VPDLPLRAFLVSLCSVTAPAFRSAIEQASGLRRTECVSTKNEAALMEIRFSVYVARPPFGPSLIVTSLCDV
jgi:hypothetical protein